MKSFLRSCSGSVAINAGLLIIPLLGAAGFAVDYAQAQSQRARLQKAVDIAAVAALNAQSQSETDRVKSAKQHFHSNFDSDTVVNSDVTVILDGDRASVDATADVPTTLSRIVGYDSLTVTASSEAQAFEVPGSRACLLSLNPSAAEGIALHGTASLIAENCWVRSNSTSTSSLSASGTAHAAATGFCAAGPAVVNAGLFSPTPNTDCVPLTDPFASLPAPLAGGCLQTDLALGIGSHTLEPGTYCGGIKLGSGADVTFNPGTYTIEDGKLHLGSGSVSIGNGVTFYFTGVDPTAPAGLDIDGGATAEFVAPTIGDYSGLVFAQDRNYQPGLEIKITGGGDLKLDGTLYLPTWKVTVQGNGSLFGTSVSWAMIAAEFSIGGTGDIYVKGNPAEIGLPDNLPGQEMAVRLTK